MVPATSLSPPPTAAALSDRAVLCLSGEGVRPFLQGLLTNDVERLTPEAALPAALLSPQGKILADMMLLEAPDGVFVDCPQALAADLKRRLTLYKLRAKIEIREESETLGVFAFPGGAGLGLPDPRLATLGRRAILPKAEAASRLEAVGLAIAETSQEFDAWRMALGVAQCGSDFPPDRLFALEANLAELGAVDFKKGCFVGQEVTARMHHRAVLRKRLWPIALEGDVSAEPGTPIKAGRREIGTLEGMSGTRGFALLRFDRLAEAGGAEAALSAAGTPVQLGAPPWLALETVLAAAVQGDAE